MNEREISKRTNDEYGVNTYVLIKEVDCFGIKTKTLLIHVMFCAGTLATLFSLLETTLTSNDYSSNAALVVLRSISVLFHNNALVFRL